MMKFCIVALSDNSLEDLKSFLRIVESSRLEAIEKSKDDYDLIRLLSEWRADYEKCADRRKNSTQICLNPEAVTKEIADMGERLCAHAILEIGLNMDRGLAMNKEKELYLGPSGH